MNKIYIILTSALALLATSCERDLPTSPDGGKVRVSISAGEGGSRTTISENGLSVLWQETDRIAVWTSDGKLSAEPFAVYYTDGSSARFTADITPMGDGSYTYYSVYPYPESVSGTTAEFTLAAAQSGSYDGRNDILVAYPASGGALEDEATQVDLTYRHKMHALRMYIPEGCNGLGEPVQRIDIDFPQSVAGRVSVDFSDEAAAARLADGTGSISIDIPDGLDSSSESARRYAYAIVFPARMSETDEIVFTLRSATRRSIVSFAARTLSEGGSTPVRLAPVPDDRTILRFSIVENNLGEKPQSVTFAAPEGFDLGSGNTLTVDAAETFDRHGYYDLDLTDAGDMSGAQMTVTFESENAVVSRTVTLPAYQPQRLTDVALTVPYLFEEDFSALAASFEHNTEFTGSDATNPSAVALDQYGLTGWTGARVGGSAGTGIRICCRYESGLGIKNVLRGRVDTAPLAAIKAGSSVKLDVTFDYGSNLFEGVGSGGSTTYWAGSTVQSGAIKGSEDIETVVLGETTIDCDGDKDNASYYGTTPHTQSFYVNSAGSATRLSWRVGTDRGGSFAGNGNYWLYIDNIRVSIAQ